MQPRPRRQATIPGMATVQYESKENAGRKFWTARSGRYAIRIDANRPGVYRWLITLEGRSVRKGIAPGRDEAAAAVSDALDELTGQRSQLCSWPCATQLDARHGRDQGICASAIAIVCRRSSTSDGLATAWPEEDTSLEGSLGARADPCSDAERPGQRR
jgi:hypothetical protein